MGHFIPAKWFKCRVEKFYLFFDPWFSLFKKKIGETVYGIGWIPLGGYVKISGMIDESMDKEQMKQPPQPWEFQQQASLAAIDHHARWCYRELDTWLLSFCNDLMGMGRRILPAKQSEIWMYM